GLFDATTPEAVRGYIIKTFNDPNLAEQYANDVVHLRAANNVEGLVALNDKLHDLYDAKFPLRKGGAAAPERTPFDAILETEAPIGFHFPASGRRAGDTML